MPFLSTMIVLGLLGASPIPVKEAVQELVICKSFRHQRCIAAATTLTNAGRKAVKPTLRAFAQMSPRAGQLLAIDVFAGNKGALGESSLGQVASNTRVDGTVRMMAIRSLSSRLSKRVTRRLMKLATTQVNMVRAEVIRALGNRPQRSNPKVLKVLIKASVDSYHVVRLEAVMGLSLARKSAGAPALLKRLVDSNMKVRRAAAAAFKGIKFKPSVLPLIKCLDNDDGLLREVAAAALIHQTGQKQFGEDYEMWREWYRSQ